MAVVIRIVPFSCNFLFIDRDKWNFFRYLAKKKNAIRNKLSFLVRTHYVNLLKEPRDEIYEKYSESGKCHQTE